MTSMPSNSAVEFFGRDSKRKYESFFNCLKASGVEPLQNLEKTGPFVSFDAKYEERPMHFKFCLKSLSFGGWPDKPWIYRIQVSPFGKKEFPYSDETHTSALLGICLVDGKEVICGWNPFSYSNKETNVSCYVLAENLESLKGRSVVKGEAKGERVIIAKGDCFKDFLREFRFHFAI